MSNKQYSESVAVGFALVTVGMLIGSVITNTVNSRTQNEYRTEVDSLAVPVEASFDIIDAKLDHVITHLRCRSIINDSVL